MTGFDSKYGFSVQAWWSLTPDQRVAVRSAHEELSLSDMESVGGFRVAAPEFKPGDVAVVQYMGVTFPYVRTGDGVWRTQDNGTIRDKDVAHYANQGRATLVLRDGQLTDDGARMAGERLHKVNSADLAASRGFSGNFSIGFLHGFDAARRVLDGDFAVPETGE